MAYDGFISYSHAADGKLAPALQRGLERLAKPWNSRRALHIFRDETGLSTNPHLWSAIEAALNESGWFVLLASPESASSEWVNKEITHWLATKSVEHILPVVTDGIWEWDPATADFSADSNAVPDELRGAMRDEPRHLDLRWARAETDLDLRNSRFRGAVADLAAPMHAVPKDDLEGEDIRQHRRARRLARGGVAALAVLLVAALVATGFAVHARHQANVATDDALAGGLTAKVNPLLSAGNYDLALLLAVEANRAASHLPPSSSAVQSARDELVHSLAAHPTLSHTLAGPQGIVSTVVYSPDGKTIVSQTTSGALRVWDAVTGAPLAHQPPPVPGTSTGLALNDAGLLVVTGAGTATKGTLETGTDKNRLWDLQTNRLWRWQPPASRFGTLVAISNNGLLAMGTEELVNSGSTARSNTIEIWNVNTGRRVGSPLVVPGSVDALKFSPDGSHLGADVITADGSAIDLVLVDAATGTLEHDILAHDGSVSLATNGRAFDEVYTPFFDGVVFSADSRRISSVVGGAKDGDIATFEVATSKRLGSSPPSQNEALDGVTTDLRDLVEQSSNSQTSLSVVDAKTGTRMTTLTVANSGVAGGVTGIAVDPTAPNLVYQPSQQGSLAVLNWAQLGPPHFVTGASTRHFDYPVSISQKGQILGSKVAAVGNLGKTFVSPSGYEAVLSNNSIVLLGSTGRAVRTLTEVPSDCASLLGHELGFTGTPTHGRIVLDCPTDPTTVGVDQTATLRSWDLNDPRSTPQWRENWSIPDNPLQSNTQYVVLSTNGNTVGVMGPAGVQVLNGRTGRVRAKGPFAGENQLEVMALSPDARTIATDSFSGQVEILETRSGKLLQTLSSSRGNLGNQSFPGDPELAFSPDGRYLAVWSNPIGLEVFDLRTSSSVAVLGGAAKVPPFDSSLATFIPGLDWGPYTQLVVSFSRSTDTVTVAGRRPIHPEAAQEFTMAQLYAGGAVWQQVQDQMRNLSKYSGPAFVRTATWSMKLSDLELSACTIVGRDLTTAEWNANVGASVPYDATCTPLLDGAHRS